MSGSLSERSWDLLIRRLQNDRLVPFLGAGAAYGTLPTGAGLANEWAEKYGYAFGDASNLIEVAQYLAVTFDALFPKELVHERFQGVDPPDFCDPNETHRVLAEYALSMYLTTNYDDFMYRALKGHQFREPARDFLRWHEGLDRWESGIGDDYVPSPGRPLVFHLHGMIDLEAEQADPDLLPGLVLTEDDYIRFLSSRRDALPPAVAAALGTKSCLFIGYRLADWNLRVILQSLRGGLGHENFLVMPPPGDSKGKQDAALRYFDDYYGQALDIKVFWGTATEFFEQLKQRLAAETTSNN